MLCESQGCKRKGSVLLHPCTLPKGLENIIYLFKVDKKGASVQGGKGTASE